MANIANPKELIQSYSSAIIEGLMSKVNAACSVEHNLTKGELRELFITNVLQHFLTSQFSIGSGIVINQNGSQSNQTDIIIYDNRILPPFIQEQHIGIFPAESVVGTIEVKSYLGKIEVKKAVEASKVMCNDVYNPSACLYGNYAYFRPLSAIVGFYNHQKDPLPNGSDLKVINRGKTWLKRNITSELFAICLVGHFSWMKLANCEDWRILSNHNGRYEETKRFIAIYLDNLRTCSETRLRHLSNRRRHYDWLSIYIRDQQVQPR